MEQKINTPATNSQIPVLMLARLHFIYVGLISLQIVLYDAWKLIVPTVIFRRWMMAGAFVVIITLVWLQTRNGRLTENKARSLLYALIATDVAVASFSVYSQRGMASRAIVLYVIPLIMASLLKTRRAIYTTAALASATYITAAVSYFIVHFNEGYKIELYGEVGVYCAVLFIIAGLLASSLKPSTSSR